MTDARRGPYKVGRQRRERILDAAAMRFATDGFIRTTLTSIAADAGITSPTLRHHFASKDAILTALAERRFDRAAEASGEWPPDLDGTGALRLMLHLTELRATEPELIEVFIRVAGMAAEPSSEAHALFAARYEGVVRSVTARFHRAVEAGHLRDDVDYEALTRILIAVADGLQLQWVLTRGGVDIVGMLREHLEGVSADILVSGERASLS